MIITDILQKLFTPIPRCSKKGCNAPAIDCYLPTPYDKNPKYYCGFHAAKEGFCAHCGQFAAGTEFFDLNDTGLCHDCDIELKALENLDWEETDEFI